jgi:hypothetical protein
VLVILYIYHGYYDDDKTDDLPNLAMETMANVL